MGPRFTRGEYWLLETVVEYQLRVCDLIYRDLELLLNKREHGLTRKSLIETFHRLLSSGLIYAKNETTGFISTYQQIELALDEPKSKDFHPLDMEKITYYGLTQEGSAQWEAFAAPDWQKYIDVTSRLADNGKNIIWEVICADKAWLEEYFESMCFYDWAEGSLASVEWDYIVPWDATYWKQLDGAHRVQFQERAENEEQDVVYYPLPKPGYFHTVWCAWR